jgi:hypothetical protein
LIPRIAVDDPEALVTFIRHVFGALGDRRAMVRDPWGNTWQIATHRGRFTS